MENGNVYKDDFKKILPNFGHIVKKLEGNNYYIENFDKFATLLKQLDDNSLDSIENTDFETIHRERKINILA